MFIVWILVRAIGYSSPVWIELIVRLPHENDSDGAFILAKKPVQKSSTYG